MAGLLLLGALVVTVTLVVRRGQDTTTVDVLADEVEEYLEESARSPGGDVLRAVGGLLLVLASAQVLVLSATTIATEVGLDAGFVGLTIVAVGTSLPELATSVQAARRRETDLVLGNLLGSKLFNSLGVAGAAALLGPGAVPEGPLTGVALVVMAAVTVAAVVAMATGRRVGRMEGGVLLAAWCATLPLVA